MWGQEIGRSGEIRLIRIIPMRVGTSALRSNGERIRKDHPHACGDKIKCAGVDTSIPGSSPCVWGQDKMNAEQVLENRIIPMRVGTRVVIFCFLSPSWDHPHACGDKKDFSAYCKISSGSSPCVWGQVIEDFC